MSDHAGTRSATVSAVISAIAALASLVGCDGPHAVNSPPVGEHGPDFADQAQLYQWIVDQAATTDERAIGVQRDARGAIVSVELRDGALIGKVRARLGGRQGYFTMRGQRVDVNGTAAGTGVPGVERQTAALTSSISDSQSHCDNSNNLCTDNESHNRHWSVFGIGYHDVGGSTDITRGGFNYYIYMALTYQDPGPCSVDGAPCPIVYYCNPGDQLDEDHICHGQSGSAEISLHNTYFTTTSNGPRPALSESSQGNTTNHLELTKWAVGKFVFQCDPVGSEGPAECFIEGVCTSHSAYSDGRSSTAFTAAGAYDCGP